MTYMIQKRTARTSTRHEAAMQSGPAKKRRKTTMNEEKSKIIAELADCVRSDLPVQEIIDNFQYLIQKLDYTNRVAAITKAIERLNDGRTYDYVAAGLREWYDIDISSQELALLLYGAEGLLPREIRYKRQLAKQEKKANQTE